MEGFYGNNTVQTIRSLNEDIINEGVISGILGALGVIIGLPIALVGLSSLSSKVTNNKIDKITSENKDELDKIENQLDKIYSILEKEINKTDLKKYLSFRGLYYKYDINMNKFIITSDIAEININKLFFDALGMNREAFIKSKGFDPYSGDSMCAFYDKVKIPTELKKVYQRIKKEFNQVKKKVNVSKDGYVLKVEPVVNKDLNYDTWAEEDYLTLRLEIPIKKNKFVEESSDEIVEEGAVFTSIVVATVILPVVLAGLASKTADIHEKKSKDLTDIVNNEKSKQYFEKFSSNIYSKYLANSSLSKYIKKMPAKPNVQRDFFKTKNEDNKKERHGQIFIDIAKININAMIKDLYGKTAKEIIGEELKKPDYKAADSLKLPKLDNKIKSIDELIETLNKEFKKLSSDTLITFKCFHKDYNWQEIIDDGGYDNIYAYININNVKKKHFSKELQNLVDKEVGIK